VADYFVAELANGPEWDPARRRREQAGWDEHAAFMDGLTDEGLVALAGPLGDGDGDSVLIVFAAESEGVVRARLADDPWLDRILTLTSVRPWSVWIRGADTPSPAVGRGA
jgi:uncharacterized protein YciI